VLGTAELLAVWESGLAVDPARRAVLLHAAARPATPAEELLGTVVGQRDADLFGLRAALFGPAMPVRVACTGCAEELEFEFDATVVAGMARPAPAPVEVTEGEWTVVLRVPTSGDLLDAGGARALLSSCALAVSRGGQPSTVDDLPAPVVASAGRAVAEADPRADVQLDVVCPECGARTEAELDIVGFLWAELDSWARATLLDVHLLASSYGWREPDVLALSPSRRRHYLELCGHA
jgi:sarcosine oxidase delta subunit